MRGALRIALLAVACGPRTNACVSAYPGASAGPFIACRQDLDAAACTRESGSSSFTPSRSCADVGYPCLHDALGAVLYEARDASGACPPRTTSVR